MTTTTTVIPATLVIEFPAPHTALSYGAKRLELRVDTTLNADERAALARAANHHTGVLHVDSALAALLPPPDRVSAVGVARACLTVEARQAAARRALVADYVQQLREDLAAGTLQVWCDNPALADPHSAANARYKYTVANSQPDVAEALAPLLTSPEWAAHRERFLAREAAERTESAAREAAEEAARQERLRASEAARAAAARAQAAAREEWIAQHGSERLRRLLAEKIEHQAVYRDERLTVERPGWEYEPDEMTLAAPRNPPMDALLLLDEARKTAADAQLRYYVIVSDDDDDDDDDDGDDGERGYVGAAKFLERSIITTRRVRVTP